MRVVSDSASVTALRRDAAGEDNEIVRRILDGLLSVVARSGADRLSMTEVAAEAGISRRTLYRHCAGRVGVMEVLGEYVHRRWEELLSEALAREPDPSRRVSVVLESMLGVAEVVPQSKAILDIESALAFDHLQRHLPDFVATILRAMGPALDTIEVVRSRELTGPQIAEIICRLTIGGFGTPADRAHVLYGRIDMIGPMVRPGLWARSGGPVAGSRPADSGCGHRLCLVGGGALPATKPSTPLSSP